MITLANILKSQVQILKANYSKVHNFLINKKKQSMHIKNIQMYKEK